jgi:hypothetical protein
MGLSIRPLNSVHLAPLGLLTGESLLRALVSSSGYFGGRSRDAEILEGGWHECVLTTPERARVAAGARGNMARSG